MQLGSVCLLHTRRGGRWRVVCRDGSVIEEPCETPILSAASFILFLSEGKSGVVFRRVRRVPAVRATDCAVAPARFRSSGYRKKMTSPARSESAPSCPQEYRSGGLPCRYRIARRGGTPARNNFSADPWRVDQAAVSGISCIVCSFVPPRRETMANLTYSNSQHPTKPSHLGQL